MVCFWYIIVNTLHKGDNKDDDDDNDNNNDNNNKFMNYYIMNKLASIFILISTYELKMLSPFPGFTDRLRKWTLKLAVWWLITVAAHTSVTHISTSSST